MGLLSTTTIALATAIAMQLGYLQTTEPKTCSTPRVVTVNGVKSLDEFSVMNAVYVSHDTLQMQAWQASDPIEHAPLQWTLNLSTYTMKSDRLATVRAFRQPCQGKCRVVVVDKSKNGRWQLIISRAEPKKYDEVWLVSGSQSIKVIDDARSLVKWQWSQDTRQFFFLAVQPFGSTYSAGLVDIQRSKVHDLNSLFDGSTILDAALNEVQNVAGIIERPLNSSNGYGTARFVRLTPDGKLILDQSMQKLESERIDWYATSKTFVFAEGDYGQLRAEFDGISTVIRMSRGQSIDPQLFEGESRRVLPSPDLKNLVLADGTGLRVYSCK